MRDTRRTRADLAHHRGIANVRLSNLNEAHALYAAGKVLYPGAFQIEGKSP